MAASASRSERSGRRGGSQFPSPPQRGRSVRPRWRRTSHRRRRCPAGRCRGRSGNAAARPSDAGSGCRSSSTSWLRPAANRYASVQSPTLHRPPKTGHDLRCVEQEVVDRRWVGDERRPPARRGSADGWSRLRSRAAQPCQPGPPGPVLRQARAAIRSSGMPIRASAPDNQLRTVASDVCAVTVSREMEYRQSFQWLSAFFTEHADSYPAVRTSSRTRPAGIAVWIGEAAHRKVEPVLQLVSAVGHLALRGPAVQGVQFRVGHRMRADLMTGVHEFAHAAPGQHPVAARTPAAEEAGREEHRGRHPPVRQLAAPRRRRVPRSRRRT